MAVAVGDDVAAGEEPSQALVPADSRAAVVNEPDPEALELGRRSHRKGSPEVAVVHVSLHGEHRTEELEVSQDGGRREVAGVNGGVRGFEDPEAVRRKRARAAREMRVSQKRDQNRLGRNAPFR